MNFHWEIPYFLKKLKKADCHTIYLGIGSDSQKILNVISKGITLARAKTINLIKKINLNTIGSFIIGIPGETVKTIKKTINFAKNLSPTFAQFTICTSYPGTKLFEITKEKGWFLTRDWSNYDCGHCLQTKKYDSQRAPGRDKLGLQKNP